MSQQKVSDEAENGDSNDLSPASHIITIKSSQKRAGRRAYTVEEDMIIMKYLIKHKCSHLVNGKHIWNVMSKRKVIDRTFESVRSRYLRVILPNLKKYNITDEWRYKLTGDPKYKAHKAKKLGERSISSSFSELSTSIDKNQTEYSIYDYTDSSSEDTQEELQQSHPSPNKNSTTSQMELSAPSVPSSARKTCRIPQKTTDNVTRVAECLVVLQRDLGSPLKPSGCNPTDHESPFKLRVSVMKASPSPSKSCYTPRKVTDSVKKVTKNAAMLKKNLSTPKKTNDQRGNTSADGSPSILQRFSTPTEEECDRGVQKTSDKNTCSELANKVDDTLSKKSVELSSERSGSGSSYEDEFDQNLYKVAKEFDEKYTIAKEHALSELGLRKTNELNGTKRKHSSSDGEVCANSHRNSSSDNTPTPRPVCTKRKKCLDPNVTSDNSSTVLIGHDRSITNHKESPSHSTTEEKSTKNPRDTEKQAEVFSPELLSFGENSSEWNSTFKQDVLDCCRQMTKISELFDLTLNEVWDALYWNCGSVEDTVSWIGFGVNKSGKMCWNHEDDSILLNSKDDPDDIMLNDLLRKYGTQYVCRRMLFLESDRQFESNGSLSSSFPQEFYSLEAS